jgi:hypothetical protein
MNHEFGANNTYVDTVQILWYHAERLLRGDETAASGRCRAVPAPARCPFCLPARYIIT